jgi:exodeoxyribonuclease V gamma subunit
MARWLWLELAKRLGVCANLRVTYPNAFLNGLFSNLRPGLPPREANPYTPEAMAFRVAARLPALLSRPEFRRLAGFLENDTTGRRLWLFSEETAGAFDRYLLFRPEMMLAWDKGEGRDWQAILWREIRKGAPDAHRALLPGSLASPPPAPELLPRRVLVFGAAALPPFHIEVFSLLARTIPVYLYHLNFCREYWAFFMSPAAGARLAARAKTAPGLLHVETGNSLLADMGVVGRDFFRLLSGLSVPRWEEEFALPPETNLLSSIQNDILQAREPGVDGREKILTAPDDCSLTVHSCHCPLREMEVLHGLLLDIFEKHPEITPRDVCALVPDVSAYAPYIEAVFGSPSDPALRVPYTIAGQGAREQSETVSAFFALLSACQGRFPAETVLDILRRRPVRECFGLGESGLARVERWVAETRICWGEDGAARKAEHLPPFEENTWRAGLARLFLGWAMEGDGTRLCQDVLPLEGMAEDEGETLAVFADFLSALFRLARDLKREHTLTEWTALLTRAISRFIGGGDTHAPEVETLYKAVAGLAQGEREHGFTTPAGFGMVKAWLDARFSSAGGGAGFLRSGVTFAQPAPMRSVPFAVVCLCGMDDGAWPPRDTAPEFDLMAKNPRPGDRSQRMDGRLVFLESLLAAQKRLIITYTGQDNQTSQDMPPSVLVSQLLDYIRRGFITEHGCGSDQIFFRHRLHAHHPDYFNSQNPRLFAYCGQARDAARVFSAPPARPEPFFREPLPAPGKEFSVLGVEDFCRFFAHPARELFRQRLGIRLEQDEEALPDAEPFSLDALEKHRLVDSAAKTLLEGGTLAQGYEAARASGLLPHGNMGRMAWEGIGEKARPFAEEVRRRLPGPPREVIIQAEAGGTRIEGATGPVSEHGLVLHRAAALKTRDLLRAFCLHLLLPFAETSAPCPGTFWVATDGTWRMPALDRQTAGERLATFLDLHRRGMREPLPFFPETSRAYAEAVVLKHKEHGEAMADALKKWEDTEERGGESHNPYNALCFPDGFPENGFRDCALAVFEPFLNLLEEV